MSGKRKVLVVDDEEPVIKFLSDTLTASGFEVASAADGKQAISQIDKERPDLVLLDIAMPEMDGFETCAALRKRSANNDLPIIMLTGLEEESAIISSFERGADDYLTKPFDNTELFKKIDVLLEKAKVGKLPSQLYFQKLHKSAEQKAGR